LCGDFNVIRNEDERKGRETVFRQVDADMFNNFIVGCSLIDLPIYGRLFTWYRGDDVSMSKLNRFLLFERWCDPWPNCIQVAYQQGISDHVPIMLHVDDANWDPRPLRMLKCWADFPGYEDFVRDMWSSLNFNGWGGFVLKQKLKMMKAELKGWHIQHSKNLDGKINDAKNRIAILDSKVEEVPLIEVEIEELHTLYVNLHSMARIQNNINWQKSRMNWLQEGDANSKKCHGYMSTRRRHNAISVVSVNGVNIEGVQNIREAVFNHFSSHYKSNGTFRPSIDGLHFRQLSYTEAGSLTKSFTMEEVKQTVWDCDSYKSPGPDGVHFGFIKQFWDILKDDFMRFLVEFHRNGKLSKGMNSTFIALIPKVSSLQRLIDFRPISLVGCM